MIINKKWPKHWRLWVVSNRQPFGRRIVTSKFLCLKLFLDSDLAKSIDAFNREEIVPFPQFDDSKFARLVDDEMGFL